jgi:hypothetical protein
LEIHRQSGHGKTRAAKGTNFDYVIQAYGELAIAADCATIVQMAAYNMVNPRVIHQERSLCSPNENPDVAREFAVADQLAAVRGGNPMQIAQTKGMQDTTGGSMWAPF